jgi:cold shock CspA family protein
MQRPLQITMRDIPHSDAVEGLIREKAGKLEQFYPHIIGCRVAVEMAQKHKHQGKLYNVRLDITVPGGEVAVNRDLDEDIHVALRDAFDAARRQLEDYGRRQRGDTKMHEPVSSGRVVRLLAEEGYGFIEGSDGAEYYFHRDNVVSPRFEQLEVGTEVQFLQEMGAERPQAKRITAGGHHLEQ